MRRSRMMTMTMMTVMIVAIELLLGNPAHAQVELYVTSSSAHISNVETGDVFASGANNEQYTSFWASGVGGGVTFNFLPIGPVKLGFDLRGSTRPGTVGADTGMGGFKVGINPPLIRIKPYVEAAAGYVGTRTVNASSISGNPTQTIGGTFSNQCAAWEILGGVDYPLVKFLDVRLIELGGGKGYDILSGTNNSNISLFTINSGLVLHF